MIKLFAGIVAFALAGASVAAEVIPPAQATGPWTGGAVTGKGAQTYCAVETGFDNGLTLSVARRPASTALTMALMVPGLTGLARGTALPAALRLDDLPGSTATATVVDSMPFGAILAIPLDLGTVSATALSGGRALTVTVAGDGARFSLAGLATALASLAACAAAVK